MLCRGGQGAFSCCQLFCRLFATCGTKPSFRFFFASNVTSLEAFDDDASKQLRACDSRLLVPARVMLRHPCRVGFNSGEEDETSGNFHSHLILFEASRHTFYHSRKRRPFLWSNRFIKALDVSFSTER